MALAWGKKRISIGFSQYSGCRITYFIINQELCKCQKLDLRLYAYKKKEWMVTTTKKYIRMPRSKKKDKTAALRQRSVKFAESRMAYASFPLLGIRMQDLRCREFRFKFSDPRPSLCPSLSLSTQTVELCSLQQKNNPKIINNSNSWRVRGINGANNVASPTVKYKSYTDSVYNLVGKNKDKVGERVGA